MANDLVPHDRNRWISYQDAKQYNRLSRWYGQRQNDQAADISSSIAGGSLVGSTFALYYLPNVLVKWLIIASFILLAAAVMIPQLACTIVQHTRLLEWSVTRTYQRLNTERIWIPREGDPHPVGRDDTYSRFILAVKYDALANTYGIFVDTWRYQHNRWHRAKSQRHATVDGDDNGEALGIARAEVQATVDRAQEQWRAAWYELEGLSPIADDESIVLKHRLADALSE